MPRKRDLDHYFSADPKSKLNLGLIRTHLRGQQFEFITASGVFSQRRVDLGTRLLIESMILPEKGRVLDIGCGYGAIGIAAAIFNPELRVFMVDVNSRAVWLTRRNLQNRHVKNAEVREGHLYEPVQDLTFACILSNPPVSAGMETVETLVIDAPRYMTEGAYFQIVVRSKTGGRKMRSILEETFGEVEVLSRKSGYRVFISEKQ